MTKIRVRPEKAFIYQNGTKISSEKFMNFPDEIHLAELIQFDLDLPTGAMVVQEHAGKLPLFKFGFSTLGLHSALSDEEFNDMFNHIEAGLRDLPYGETLTFESSSFVESQSRIRQLLRLKETVTHPTLLYLLDSEIDKAKELESRQIRKPKKLRIYASFNPNKIFEGRGKDPLDKALTNAYQFFDKAKAKIDPQIALKKQKELFSRVYHEGFLLWHNYLENQIGLDVKSLNAGELWEEMFYQVNPDDEICPEIPQLIYVNANPSDPAGVGIDVTMFPNRDLCSSSVIGAKNLPIFDMQWVHTKKQFVSALTFEEKPGSWASKKDQLSYLWNLLKDPQAGNMRITTQICRVQSGNARQSLEKIQRQAKAAQRNTKGADNVGAEIRAEQAKEAERDIHDGNHPLSVATTILIYRDTLQKLNTASMQICSMFMEPAQVVRDKNYTWKVWLQTLPARVDKLLTRCAVNRRLQYSVSETMGFLNVTTTNTPDTDGVELISEDGSSIFIDLFDKLNPMNMFALATTRGGKSAFISKFLLHALLRDIPIVAMDYPKKDGSSTFTCFTEIMGKDGAYYNILNQSYNLFEKPNVSKLSPEVAKTNLLEFINSLRGIVIAIIGDTGDVNLNNLVANIIEVYFNKFWENPGIQRLYDEAYAAGRGTEAWEKMPTLHHFKDSIPQPDLNSTSLKAKAYEYIHLRLERWLNSGIANAIAKPSTIDIDAKILVYAFTGVQSDEEMSILGLAALSAAHRRSLQYEASIVLIDESPILFEFPLIARIVAQMCANLGKSGGRVLLSAQSMAAISKSGFAKEIMDNMKIKCIGRIEESAIPDITDPNKLNMNESLVKHCAGRSFKRKKHEDFTRWLIKYEGNTYFVRCYLSKMLLAAVGNNPPEQKVREYFMEYLPPEYALRLTAEHLNKCLQLECDPVEQKPPPQAIERWYQKVSQEQVSAHV